MPEVPARERVVDPLRHRAHDLQLDLTGRRRSRGRREPLAGHLLPAEPEVLCHVRDGRPLDANGRVVPAEPAACRMSAGVEAVARLRREVDPADEGDAVVDHDRLLVVAVHRTLACVEAALDAGLPGEGVAHLRDVLPRRAEERQGRAGPGQDADVDALGEVREQMPQHHRALAPLEREVGGEEPAGEVNVRPGRVELPGDRRKRLGAVDQDVDRVPGRAAVDRPRPNPTASASSACSQPSRRRRRR